MKPVLPEPVTLATVIQRDPLLAQAVKRVPPYPGFPLRNQRDSHFHALARSILYQQLANAAARTIYQRVCALTPDGSFPTASNLLALPDQALRDAGVSRNKMRALRDLAGKVDSGELRLRSIGRHPDEEVIGRLTSVWGIGLWSAQMFLMVRLGRLDVMPATDLGIREGVRRLDGLAERPSPGYVLDRSEAWRPFRSVASWVLWRLCDE